MGDLEQEAQAVEAAAGNLETDTRSPDAGADALVDQWLADYFPPSFITRDSAGWQHIIAAAAELKRRLKGD
jgi:hypothetical protein